jgi:hypothetical protein
VGNIQYTRFRCGRCGCCRFTVAVVLRVRSLRGNIYAISLRPLPSSTELRAHRAHRAGGDGKQLVTGHDETVELYVPMRTFLAHIAAHPPTTRSRCDTGTRPWGVPRRKCRCRGSCRVRRRARGRCCARTRCSHLRVSFGWFRFSHSLLASTWRLPTILPKPHALPWNTYNFRNAPHLDAAHYELLPTRVRLAGPGVDLPLCHDDAWTLPLSGGILGLGATRIGHLTDGLQRWVTR